MAWPYSSSRHVISTTFPGQLSEITQTSFEAGLTHDTALVSCLALEEIIIFFDVGKQIAAIYYYYLGEKKR